MTKGPPINDLPLVPNHQDGPWAFPRVHGLLNDSFEMRKLPFKDFRPRRGGQRN